MVHPVLSKLSEKGLAEMADQLSRIVKPSVRLRAEPAQFGAIQTGASKIGGLPDLEPATPWPTYENTPLAFLCQLNCVEMASFGCRGDLPDTGLLSFFYDARQNKWGFDPNDRGSWRVLYIAADPASLKRRAFPDTLPEEGRFDACRVSPRKEVTLAPWESKEFEALGLTEKQREIYFGILDEIERDSLIHRVLGHPDAAWGEMPEECQLASNGIYCGDGTAWNDPRAREVLSGADRWRLLLQIDSDENAGMMWGDKGRLYFWITGDDLKERRFENVWMVLHCGPACPCVWPYREQRYPLRTPRIGENTSCFFASPPMGKGPPGQ